MTDDNLTTTAYFPLTCLERSKMTQRTRREFIRDIGIAAGATPFILNLPSIGFANQQRRKQRIVIMFSPDGVVQNNFWPDAEGSLADMTLKESLSPLEPFKDRML